MLPRLLRIGSPFTDSVIVIQSYGVMLAVAVLGCVLLAERQARHLRMEKNLVATAGLLGFVAGLAGARLVFLASHPAYLLNDFGVSVILRVFRPGPMGLDLYGGLIIGGLTVAIYLAARRKPVLAIFDHGAVYLALAIALGRLGSFLNGDCYGKPTQWFLGIVFPNFSLPYLREGFRINTRLYPVQAFAIAAALITYGVLSKLSQGSERRVGLRLAVFCVMYPAFRFAFEFFRLDTASKSLDPFNVPQVVGVPVFFFGVWLLMRCFRPKRVSL